MLKKAISPNIPSKDLPTNKPVNAFGKVVPPLGFGAFADSDDEGEPNTRPSAITRGHSQKAPGGGGAIQNVGPGGYSKEEIAVLRYKLT